MAELGFECLRVDPQRYAAAPTLLFRLRITDTAGEPVHALALRCQIRIEPIRRRYSDAEADLLTGLFGDRARWGDTMRPIQLATESVLVPGFTGVTEVELAVPCSYDLEVAAGKYFHALDDGVVPLLMLFSGTVFVADREGFRVEQVPWDREATCRMPVTVWRELMDLYFPESGWLRLRRDTLDDLLRYQARHAIPTGDAALASLLAAGEA